MTTRDDTASLVRRAQQGDESAMGQLFDAYAPQVHSTLCHIIGPDGELDDLLQETLIKAFRSLKTLESPEAFAGWLRRIAIFTARSYLRSKARRRWLRLVDAPDPARDDAHEPRRLLRRTYALLDRLPPDERLAFTLRFIEEMSLPEVAEGCGVSLATAKRRLARARKRFDALVQTDPVVASWARGERRD